MEPEENDIHRIAQGWIGFHQLPEESAQREQFDRAYDELSDLIRDAPEQAWDVIKTICETATDDSILSNLAAGPMEDLLVLNGAAVIDQVMALAEVDSKFKKVLAAVWQRDMPDEIWRRIQTVAHPSW